uniref:Maintenance of Photosystem II under High light 2 C-terminal domain-containing protein n=1 Tax=Oryza brachyantha TaxID=4533 RepID=J3MHF4_ORYBR
MVVAIATEAWALAGCGAAAKAVAQEAPVQLQLQQQHSLSAAKAKKPSRADLIYKLSKVGQAIDKNDLPAASTVLGPNSDAQWVQNVNAAFTKFSSSPEEKNMVDSFNSSLASLITSVNKSDVDSSKSAFVSSATTLEKWITSAGLSGQLKGF